MQKRAEESVIVNWHVEFHSEILRATNLPALEILLLPIQELMVASSVAPHGVDPRDPAAWRVSAHRKVLEAVASRDEQRVVAACEEHWSTPLRGKQFKRTRSMRIGDMFVSPSQLVAIPAGWWPMAERRVRVGADVGGTFTDVVAAVGDGRGPRPQGALDAARVRPRRRRGRARLLADDDVVGRGRPRDDRRDERGAREARRADRDRDDRRASATCSSCAGCGCRTCTTTSGRKPPRSCRAGCGSRSTSACRRRARSCARSTTQEALRVAGELRDAERRVRSPSACSTPTSTRSTSELLGEVLRARASRTCRSRSRREILREQQEYERTATTAVNAYIRPLMAGYLDDIRTGIGDVAGRRRSRSCSRRAA